MPDVDAYQRSAVDMANSSSNEDKTTASDDGTTGMNDSSISPNCNGDMPYSDVFTSAPTIAQSRYSRQLLIPSISIPGQSRISSSKVLIVGLGGLGSPAALYLAGAGTGTLGLLDDDVVETSNLHRQVVHREDSVNENMSKVASAARGCRELNSEITVVEYELRVGSGRMGEFMEIVKQYDVVLDCSDNPATRYAISDTCVVLGKALVSGAAEKLGGQMMVLNYANPPVDAVQNERGPCYRCAFPIPPPPDMVKGCSEIGILGPVVGTVGTLMASECIRVIVKGGKEVRKPWMLLYSAWSTDPKGIFRTIGMRGRRRDCVACGDEEVLAGKGLKKLSRADIVDGRMDYLTFCGAVEDVKVLDAKKRMDAKSFLDAAKSNRRKGMKVIDVREEHEVVLGPKISGSINIPLPKILMKDGTAKEQIQRFVDDSEVDSVVFVCPRGNDSQIAARKLLDGMSKPGDGTKFIGDVAGGFTAITRHIEKSDDQRPP